MSSTESKKLLSHLFWWVTIVLTLFVTIFVYADNQSSPKYDYEKIDYSFDYSSENVSKLTKKALKRYLEENIKNELVNDKGIWSWDNMQPYYSPNEEEKKAIIEAYWETFIKDWKDYKLNYIKSDSSTSTFSCYLTYNWPSPDIDQLNKMIDDRENVLKKEVGYDFQKMFQTIVKELPDMIRKTPQKEAIIEKDTISSIDKIDLIYANNNKPFSFNGDPFPSLKFPLEKVYP